MNLYPFLACLGPVFYFKIYLKNKENIKLGVKTKFSTRDIQSWKYTQNLYGNMFGIFALLYFCVLIFNSYIFKNIYVTFVVVLMLFSFKTFVNYRLKKGFQSIKN